MTGPVRHDRAVAAEQLLTALYPEPWSVGESSGSDVRRTWTAIPSASRPRLLVPADDGRAAARAARRQLTGDRLRTRVARSAISGALAAGVLPRLTATRVVVSGPAGAPSVEDVLGAALDLPDVRLALPVGPARANRKPVLQVVDRDGEVVAFAKVGHNALTARLVRRESEVLAVLPGSAPPGLRIPRLLASTRWEDREVLVQEALDVPRRRLRGVEAQARLLRVVADIAGLSGPLHRHDWAAHPFHARLRERLSDCGAHADALEAALRRVRFSDTVVTGAWHGDLNSGNLALVAGACPVWDWERFESDVPLGFDLLHHRLHEQITVHGVPAREAASELVHEAGRLLSPLGVAHGDAGAVARVYLLALASRYLGDDQAAAGASLGSVDTWLLPAVSVAGAGRAS